MKTAIIVMSDPASTAQEALGRVLNALAATYEYKQNDVEVKLVFQGTGTRWPAELSNPEHPAYEIFTAVMDKVAGVSSGCSDLFGAAEGALKVGMTMIGENPIPKTSGLPSFMKLQQEGWNTLIF